jgi:TonB-linked SusC/RagA family outer membrane protein
MNLYALNNAIGVLPRWLRQTLLVMRITTLILITTLLQVSASSFAQKITFAKRSATLKEIFKEIRTQTGYNVLYSDTKIDDDQTLSVNFNDTDLKEVLKVCTADLSLVYTIDDKNIIISKKEPTFLERVVDRWVSIDVRGRVTDAEGKSLPGASVKVKATGRMVSTDGKGEFFLRGVEEGAVLVVSFIGYLQRELRVEKELGNVALEMSDSKLDEVQVIAYGTTTRRLSTGNISTVKAEDIAKSPVQNPLLALQGRIPGIMIEQSTGYANSAVKVRIQGQNSIKKGNEPLYVIDGVPYVSQLLSAIDNNILGNNGTVVGGNPLSFINPNDIEGIDVLKDADATSIYGSRAANGAIIITTKKGKSGDTRINASIQNGWAQVSRKLDLLSTEQYLKMRREAKINDNSPIVANDQFGDVDLIYWPQTKQTDWQKELIGGTAKQFDASLSASGGTQNTQYLLSGAYHKETTVVPGNLGDQKGTFHFNVGSSSKNDRLKIVFSANYLFDQNKIPTADLTNEALLLAPNAPDLYSADGKLNWETVTSSSGAIFNTWNNPLIFTSRKYVSRSSNLISNLNIAYEILPGLIARSSFGYTTLQVKESSTTPIDILAAHVRTITQRGSKFADNNINSISIEPQLNYQNIIGPGKVELLLGTSIYQNNQNGKILRATGFNSDLILEDLKSASTITAESTTIVKYRYNALFARLNYNLQDKYILNFNARRDGSSRFGPENRFHNFGSVAAAWLFSNTEFVKTKMPILSFGKLRVSYGTTGNDQIDDYGYLSLYQATNDNGVPYQGIKGLQPRAHENPYLQWEETRKFQIGLDFSLFKDKIIAALNYNYNRSSNQLLNYSLPPSTGFESISANFPAVVQNKGYEVLLNSDILKGKKLNWSTGFNITVPKNKIVEFKDLASSIFANTYVIGKSINIQKLYEFAGVNPTTGIYQFINAEGSLVSRPVDPTDRIKLITPDPILYGGFTNSLTFNGLTLDFLFQFVKQKTRNSIALGNNTPGSMLNQPSILLNRWQDIDQHTAIQKVTSGGDINAVLGKLIYADGSDALWGDGSYVRLKNVSLSYQLSNLWQEKVHLKGALIYLQGQNLLTITNYNGLDPETKSSTVLPPLRVFTMGIQITL